MRTFVSLAAVAALSALTVVGCSAVVPNGRGLDGGAAADGNPFATPEGGVPDGPPSNDATADAEAGVSPPCASALNRYVSPSGSDANDGASPATAYKTISHAAASAQPGYTVHVLPGTYPESIFADVSGTANARICFLSDAKWMATITGDGHGDPAFQLRQASYVDIVNFEVTNVTGYEGIEVLTQHVIVRGNHVHDVSGGCKLGQYALGGAGINIVGVDIDVSDNAVHDVGDYLNPHGCEATHGMYVENSGRPVSGFSGRIRNNIIFRNESDGITSWHCATQFIATNNTIFENGKSGILVGANDPGCLDDNTIVANNILVHNGWHDACAPGAVCPYGSHYGDGGIVAGGSVGPHNQFLNNLLFQNLFQGAVNDAIHLAAGTEVGTISGQDPGLVSYQPDGTGDYHLLPTSPAVDAGTPLTAPLDDFDGYARPYGRAFDIGAFEWHP